MRVAVAGTFGPIHDGHRRLFESALELGTDGVVVGLTSDAFASESRDREVPSFEAREQVLKRELTDMNFWGRPLEIRKIASEDAFAATEHDLDGVVVSPETYPETADINETRRENDFDELIAVVVPLVRDAEGERISSTRIVEGEVDEHGAPTPS
ncbi:phosphopantetheine adenylyltransferase [Haloarchaeobius amylolyticus]|uniref:phosphopantetheine adenylyltransferase n=1 Tax=Haloarchaeobius amylolyticus TaxID=1198296 RepID=UPI0022715443|nr:pantetheine-phosphate adenylyltransferase [Haloarchaeobius amylolyticus]